MCHTCSLYNWTIVFTACQEDYSTGILWQRHDSDQLARVRCSTLHSNFRSGVDITRMCYFNGEWADVDMSSCTMRSDASPLVMVETDNGNVTVIVNEVCIRNLQYMYYRYAHVLLYMMTSLLFYHAIILCLIIKF